MIWCYGAPGPVCIYIVRNLYTKFSMVGFTLTEGIQISDSKLNHILSLQQSLHFSFFHFLFPLCMHKLLDFWLYYKYL